LLVPNDAHSFKQFSNEMKFDGETLTSKKLRRINTNSFGRPV